MGETKETPNLGGPSYLVICLFSTKVIVILPQLGMIRLLWEAYEDSTSYAASRTPNLVGLGQGLRIYITHVLLQEANDGVTGSFFETLPFERLPVFLEVGLTGSQAEVISGTKSILGVKHTGLSGCICRHLAP